MSDKRYEANIIRTTAVEPANNLQSTSAPGVWSLDEVMELQKKNKWPTVGNVATDIDDIFSTFLYTGTGSAQTITNNIDLSGEGGLVWSKARDSAQTNTLFDTERGATKSVFSNGNLVEYTLGDALTGFTSSGYTLGGDASGPNINGNGTTYTSWTFRKAPKFFDVVTYTGNGTAGRTISHSLNSNVGMIIVKRTDSAENWTVWHRDLETNSSGETTQFLKLNTTDGAFPPSASIDSSSSPVEDVRSATSTTFTVGNDNRSNANGGTYVAYLFAHNNNDGGFGPDQDQDIIKCGSYTGIGSSTGPSVNLGFEPQFVMIKNASSTQNWWVLDNMRGIVSGGADIRLKWNSSDSEDSTGDVISLTSTGFDVTTSSSSTNANGDTYIYMAIRRGPLAQPTAGTQVFAIGERGQNSPPPAYQAGFTVDMFTNRSDVTATTQWYTFDRLRGKIQTLFLDDTTSEQAYGGNAYAFDQMQGIGSSTNSDVNNLSWMWKRAPGYFDVVAYTGTGSARTLNHNLGVAPEMIWLKQRNTSQSWDVYHQGMDASAPQDYYMQLNSTGARSNNSNRWNDTAPTSSVFTVGTAASVNGSGDTYIAYLFATVTGVSKLGSYTGDGTEDGSKVIDCGFSSGSRFVLIKRTDSLGGWQVFDTERGLVAGNDPRLQLESSLAQTTGYDFIDPHNSGFIVGVSTTSKNAFNVSSANYIFYAIA